MNTQDHVIIISRSIYFPSSYAQGDNKNHLVWAGIEHRSSWFPSDCSNHQKIPLRAIAAPVSLCKQLFLAEWNQEKKQKLPLLGRNCWALLSFRRDGLVRVSTPTVRAQTNPTEKEAFWWFDWKREDVRHFSADGWVGWAATNKFFSETKLLKKKFSATFSGEFFFLRQLLRDL